LGTLAQFAALVLIAAPRAPADGGAGAKPPADLGALADILKASPADGGERLLKYRWSVPELEHTIDVPSTQSVNGLPVRFSAAVSRAKPDFLLKYYVDEFAKAGLYLPPPSEQVAMGGNALQVTGLDTDNLVSYTVILQVASDRYTTVIMGHSYLEPWMRGARPDDFAPLFPQSEAVVRSRAEGVDVLQFVTDAEPKAVRTFYGEVLLKAGYVAVEPDVFARGAERISLKLVKSPKAGVKQTGVVLQRRVGGGPDKPPIE
jgi:hypothetical protein